MAQDFVSGAYMVCPVSEETVAATDGYIAASAPPAALHRLLIEGRDEVLRSLRCQARDREAYVLPRWRCWWGGIRYPLAVPDVSQTSGTANGCNFLAQRCRQRAHFAPPRDCAPSTETMVNHCR